MAFTAGEKDTLMGLLGWSVAPDDLERFNDAIAQVEAVASAETRVKSLLTKIAAIEAQIDTARNTVGSPYAQLLAEAQRNVYLIGNTLGVEVRKRAFG